MKRKQIGLLHWITSSFVQNKKKKYLKDSHLVFFFFCFVHNVSFVAGKWYTITGKNHMLYNLILMKYRFVVKQWIVQLKHKTIWLSWIT